GRRIGTERFENFGRRPDIDGAEQPDDDEPGEHDRAEQAADARGAAVLHREQRDQDRQRQRQDEVVERRRDELEALHGGKHGNRRRDDAVAIEQRRARDAKQDQNRNLRTVGNFLDQRQQRKDSAFAVVVGAQDEDDVFERYHRHQRPEDQRDDPKDVGCGRDRMPGGAQRDGKR